MKNVIYKYEERVGSDTTILQLPIGAKILTTQVQNNIIYFWIQINPSEVEIEQRVIRKIATGQKFDSTKTEHIYVGSVQQGPYVWHYFEVL